MNDTKESFAACLNEITCLLYHGVINVGYCKTPTDTNACMLCLFRMPMLKTATALPYEGILLLCRSSEKHTKKQSIDRSAPNFIYLCCRTCITAD
jgi:hypothetical protein